MRMKRHLLIIITISGMMFLQCKSQDWSDALKQTTETLDSEKAVRYKFDNVVTEGVSGLEPFRIFYSGEFAFHAQSDDDILGYHLYKTQKGIHPRFNMEHELTYLYDGKAFYYQNIAPVITQFDSLPLESLDVSRLLPIRANHLPELLKSFENPNDSYELLHQSDTLYKGSDCFKYILRGRETGFMNTVVISKQNHLPLYLKVVLNEFQPYIVENYFYNYEFPDSFEYSIIKPAHSINSTEETRADIFIEGKRMPRLISQSLEGAIIDTEREDVKVIFWGFSSLFCAPCLASYPSLSGLYQRLSQLDSLEFVICHPSDPKERLKQFVDVKNVNYPLYLKPEDFETWRYVIAYPTFLIIDESKTIIHKHVGGVNEEVASELEKIIKKQIANANSRP